MLPTQHLVQVASLPFNFRFGVLGDLGRQGRYHLGVPKKALSTSLGDCDGFLGLRGISPNKALDDLTAGLTRHIKCGLIACPGDSYGLFKLTCAIEVADERVHPVETVNSELALLLIG
jgi:hypothetical protein